MCFMFLPITRVKPSAGVTKCSKCMGSHVARDISSDGLPVVLVLRKKKKSFPKYSFFLIKMSA